MKTFSKINQHVYTKQTINTTFIGLKIMRPEGCQDDTIDWTTGSTRRPKQKTLIITNPP